VTERDVWYFAYGSNLNMSQMMTRVGEWKTSAKATLKGYRLLFNVESQRWGGMAANLRKTTNPQDIIYGAIYLISNSKLCVLTDYEHVEPQSVMVESEGKQVSANIYIFSTNRTPAKPPPAYLNTLLDGLRQHGYGEDVIEEVKRISEQV